MELERRLEEEQILRAIELSKHTGASVKEIVIFVVIYFLDWKGI
jgi:hypothetical protein